MVAARPPRRIRQRVAQAAVARKPHCAAAHLLLLFVELVCNNSIDLLEVSAYLLMDE